MKYILSPWGTFLLTFTSRHHGKRQFIYISKFWDQTILTEKVSKLKQKWFATKQRKMYFTKGMGKIRMPHI